MASELAAEPSHAAVRHGLVWIAEIQVDVGQDAAQLARDEVEILRLVGPLQLVESPEQAQPKCPYLTQHVRWRRGGVLKRKAAGIGLKLFKNNRIVVVLPRLVDEPGRIAR